MHFSSVIREGLSRDLSEHVQEIVELGPVVFDPCERTDSQTRSLQYFAPLPSEVATTATTSVLTAFFQEKVGKPAPER